jgi:predicted DNA-binding protein with PD1-like motif
MRIMIVLLVLGILTDAMIARQTRIEITNPASANDSKPNSDSIPGGYAINGQFERVTILRFKYQQDLLTGLEEMVKQQKIRNAVILSGIGSVTNYRYHTVSNRTFPSKNLFVSDSNSQADIAAMNGYIIDGRIHAHITFANVDRAFGGHLEKGTTVFTFAIVTVGILKDGVDLQRIDDKSYR